MEWMTYWLVLPLTEADVRMMEGLPLLMLLLRLPAAHCCTSLTEMAEVILTGWRRERWDDLLELDRFIAANSDGMTKVLLGLLLLTRKTFLTRLATARSAFFAVMRKLLRFF